VSLARNAIIAGGAVYVLGLICAAVTSFAGYLSTMASVESIGNTISATDHTCATAYQQQPAVTPEDMQSLQQRAAALLNRSIWLRRIAVGTGVLSLLCFVIGAISGCLLITFRPV
jgi:hypothetical protein